MRRRRFLHLGAGLSVAITLGGCTLPVIPKRPKAAYADALGWIRFEEGSYELWLPRVEMGQQIATALRRIACEELGIDPEMLCVVLAGTTAMPRVRATVGSESVRDFALPLAQASATLREALARGERSGTLHAEAWPAARLRAFRRPQGAHGGRVETLVHGREIVVGAPLFASDQRRRGMRYGRVLRAPTTPELESRAASWDEIAARTVPGFVALVRDARLRQGQAEGLGIVAETPGALDRIEQALAVQWVAEQSGDDAAIAESIDIDAHRARGRLPHAVQVKGRMDDDLPWDVDLRIDTPLAAHAPIEPRVAVAEPRAEGGIALWAGSQDVYYVRDVIARGLGLAENRVEVFPCRVGGAFGGKTICTVELEAALLALAVGAPVKVQWSRTQEYRQGFHRPPTSHRIRARLRNGRLEAWQHHFASSHILFTAAVLPPWLQRTISTVAGDGGVARGATLPYDVPAVDVRYALVRLPVFSGPWRGLGAGPNGLAIESAMDECALAAGVDPVEFRLRHIVDERLADVLRAAVAAAPALPAADAPLREGRGVACGIYKETSYAAVVADVVVGADGAVRVRSLVCAHDCGRVIDPDSVRAQCEGNLVWGIGMVLSDDLRLREGRLMTDQFATAPVPRMVDIPPLRVVLVERDEPPGGAGETAIVAAAAAIANAIRAATGRRPTRFPLVPSEFA